jgi:hypothetical protein
MCAGRQGKICFGRLNHQSEDIHAKIAGVILTKKVPVGAFSPFMVAS